LSSSGQDRRWPNSPPDGQLYDLERDPHEMNNLFRDPAHAPERRELESLLRDWQKQTGDYFKLPD